MKVIETEIIFDDYNYVEGTLELKVSGNKISSFSNETFSVDSILSTKFIVLKKYLAPNIPNGIKKDKNFAIKLPFKIPTYIENSDLAFNVDFDSIICDDDYVTDNGYLKINRYNTVKDGNKIYSTIQVVVYGLKKRQRSEFEKVTFYELFPKVVGKGSIKISPKKEYYSIGEKVKVEALPNASFEFLKWHGDFQKYSDNEIEFTVEKDFHFEAVFSDDIKEPVSKNFDYLNHDYSDKNSLEEVESKWWNPINKGFKNESTDFHIEPSGKGCLGNVFEGVSSIFRTIGYLFYGAIFLIIILALIKAFGWYFLILVGILILLLILPRILNYLSRFNVLVYLLNIFLAFVLLASLIAFFNSFNKGAFNENQSTVETPKTIERVKENTSIDYVHYIQWKDYSNNNYSTYLKINSDFVNYESIQKEASPEIRTENDYNMLLEKLYENSKESLYYTYKSLDSIKNKNNINREKFPELIVSMVQHIPYYAILNQSCNPFDYQDQSIRELLHNNPCQGYIKHGIKTPAEFLKDIKGDCDSRTLLLYTILKHYNYDVAIFGSDYYKHSLLGIVLNKPINEHNLSFKLNNNKKYYLWETTNTGYKPGIVAPEIQNTNYWSLNLK